MALLGQKFVADETQIQEKNYDPIPEGTYQAKVVSTEVKESKSGGHYLNVRFDITDGKTQGELSSESLCCEDQKEEKSLED